MCIPIEEDRGIESIVCSHFGSAPAFLLYETEKDEIKVMDNQNLHHSHGACQPMIALKGEAIDAVIVGGIGRGAIDKLNAMGIKVYQSKEGTVKQNIDFFKKSALIELTPDNACVHHNQ